MRSRFIIGLALCLLVVSALNTASVQGADAKIKTLIVTGFDVGSHEWEASTRMVRAILVDSGRFDVTISTDKEVFQSPDLKEYQAIILNFGFWDEADPSEGAKAGLLDYVKNGGSVVALHFASSAFQDWKEYGDLLGRYWKKGVGGHGPYGSFEVRIDDDEKHPITRGMKSFTIEDELYAKLSGEEDIEILASADSDWSGKVEPIVFVKQYGEGRIVHNVLGHSLDSKQNPSYQRLLLNGVEWAATGDVTAP